MVQGLQSWLFDHVHSLQRPDRPRCLRLLLSCAFEHQTQDNLLMEVDLLTLFLICYELMSTGNAGIKLAREDQLGWKQKSKHACLAF